MRNEIDQKFTQNFNCLYWSVLFVQLYIPERSVFLTFALMRKENIYLSRNLAKNEGRKIIGNQYGATQSITSIVFLICAISKNFLSALLFVACTSAGFLFFFFTNNTSSSGIILVAERNVHEIHRICPFSLSCSEFKRFFLVGSIEYRCTISIMKRKHCYEVPSHVVDLFLSHLIA